MLSRIDHIGVAVEDLDAAIALHETTYGMLKPLGPDTPVGKFLARKGPGLHHVAYQVTDIESVLSSLRGSGVRLIDETPRTGIRSSRVAFLHPAATGAVLTEIVQPAEAH
jgi:methylmalonyl-CoA/ethylmalonyl-CoA epimerase